MGDQDWMVSLDHRDQKEKEETGETKVSPVEMVLVFLDHLALLDPQGRLSTHLVAVMMEWASKDLRVIRDCRVKQDSLAQWDQREIEVTQACQELQSRVKKENLAQSLGLMAMPFTTLGRVDRREMWDHLDQLGHPDHMVLKGQRVKSVSLADLVVQV